MANGYTTESSAGGFGDTREIGSGKIHVMRAVSWALRTVFKNWVTWIVGAIALIVATMAVSLILSILIKLVAGDNSVLTALVSGFVSLFPSVLLYNAAVRQLDRPKTGLGDYVANVNAGPLIAVIILLAAAGAVVALGWTFLTTGSLSSFSADPAQTASEEFSSFLKTQSFSGLIGFLVAPLLLFIPYFVADRQAGVFDGIGQGVRAGAANYFHLLLAFVVVSICAVLVTLVTLGLALIVVWPFLVLLGAHLYRQAARLPLPVDAR